MRDAVGSSIPTGIAWYAGVIDEIQRQSVLVRLTGNHCPGNEASLKITLVQAISRGERMDYCLQKATELGVFCIQPVTSRRVEVRLDKKRQVKRPVFLGSYRISKNF